MENFKKSDSFEKKENKKEKELTRREFLKKMGIGTAGVASVCLGFEGVISGAFTEVWGPSRYEKHGWYYTFKEMKEIYENEYQSPEKILKNIFHKEGGKWTGVIRGEKFEVPQEFIDKTLEHFKEMLEKKLVRYLFRLDASHGHFFVSQDRYEAEYSQLNGTEQACKLVGDKALGVLFHNFEHLLVTENSTPEEKEIFAQRNVVAWHDGRPLEILPLPKKEEGQGLAVSAPGRQLRPFMNFAAHKDGEYAIMVNGKEICLDISFDDPTYY